MSLSHNPIIVALDVPNQPEALQVVETLGDSVGFYKIGMQLFTRLGPSIVNEIRARGARVFLDLKFHDIPNTVEHAVRSACELGVDLMTIHLSGGSKMVQAAARGAEGSPALILGVTVLTSSSQETLREVAIESTVEDQVMRLARIAHESGLGGVVASPQELPMLRREFGGGLKIVTPGVRPTWAAANDQQRIMTPREAVAAGADYLVIGRPILAHANPRKAALKILEEIARD